MGAKKWPYPPSSYQRKMTGNHEKVLFETLLDFVFFSYSVLLAPRKHRKRPWLSKENGGGSHYTWGVISSELIDEYNKDDDNIIDVQYYQIKNNFRIHLFEKNPDQLKTIDNFDKSIKPIIGECFNNGDA